MAPQAAKMGHDKEEQTVQNLMIAFAVENSELAMYEALAAVAAAAGDSITENLAREIQKEEKTAAENLWKLLPAAAASSFAKVTAPAPASPVTTGANA
jgi:ferritin-like metal-binding protein YciE